MTQQDSGFSIFQAEKALNSRRYWEKMKKWGFVPYLAMNFAISICSTALVESILLLGHWLGWFRSPPPFSLAELLLIATIAGGFTGVASWFKMKRKFNALPPEENYSAK
jgi:hypothetical protein